MDLKDYLKKYKWLIIIVPLVTLIATFFKVKDLARQYSSEALISTGLVDQSKQIATEQNMDYFKISQQFSNIIEKIKLKKVSSMLSYSLIIHDLENPEKPFKKYSKKMDSLSTTQRTQAIAQFKEKLLNREILALSDTGSNNLYDLVASMGYDQTSINKELSIERQDNSDFISVGYTSENSALSVFVVNTLTTDFIDNYTRDVQSNQGTSISLLDSLLRKKQAVMNEKNAALKQFKSSNGVINLDKQSEIAFTQISAAEDRKAQALREIQANQAAITSIDQKLNGKDPYLSGNTVSENREIIDLNRQLTTANNRYVDGNFKAADKRRVDSLSSLLNIKTSRISDNNSVDPRANKQSLITQRTTLQIALDQAKGSINSINKELAQLRAQYNSMVPFDAGIQNYERDAESATKDYMGALDQYNQTKTTQYIGPKLNISQLGLIGKPEPSKKFIYLGLSGFASFFLCFMAVVVLFFLDNSINNTDQLVKATNYPVLGSIDLIPFNGKTIKSIWNEAGIDNASFKNSLRSLRLEISNIIEHDDAKIVGITSIVPGEGKSFVSSSLAYAFAMTGKRVLLVGGENELIENNNVKELMVKNNFVTFLEKREFQVDDLITVVSKTDSNTSLLEIQTSENLRAGFKMLKKEFDIIIVDINSLQEANVAKEWLQFTEKNIAVFEAGKTITDKEKNLLNYLKEHQGFAGWVINKVVPV
ncbi:exopolysaccharide transport family protein [Mucilaginibacter aquaedulcis]|uniref:exopolysaccharide transport family protein n=1 Tax=Mucilaginibacter aquaedulcis TaxID=1187081 RepID=UPI0025B6056C|nr:lipopolysaccharide biosynthesis protein [Mucilaginibacter aquaedulcis]MDN3548273.1 lipopolysaccharide biosynthesis protein [Mucilaginibacter aquaedulcis]